MTKQEKITNAKLEYQSDISWQYTAKSQTLSIMFSQDSDGKNSIDEFCTKKKGMWFDLIPNKSQIKMMYDKLNNTSHREVEIFSDAITDEYDYNGVKRSDFF